jgi:DNA-binding transcriptional MerR regulator
MKKKVIKNKTSKRKANKTSSGRRTDGEGRIKRMDLLRKKDLHERLGVAKSTVADWITEFSVYIPVVRQGNATYYKPEAIDVLTFIKQLRDQNYSKPQIMTMLAERGFPITVDEAIEDVQKIVSGENYRDTLLTVMHTMGQAVAELAEQNKALQHIQTRLDEQDGRLVEGTKILKDEIAELNAESVAEFTEQRKSLQHVQERQNEQDGRITEIERSRDLEVEMLKKQIEEMKSELAAVKEGQRKKGFFRRLFGR